MSSKTNKNNASYKPPKRTTSQKHANMENVDSFGISYLSEIRMIVKTCT